MVQKLSGDAASEVEVVSVDSVAQCGETDAAIGCVEWIVIAVGIAKDFDSSEMAL